MYQKWLLYLFLILLSSRCYSALSNVGTDFWLLFPRGSGSSPKLFITSNFNTTGNVNVPGIAFAASFSVTAGTTTTVILPASVSLDDTVYGSDSEFTESKGIHVTALQDIGVFGDINYPAADEAYLGYPTSSLGTDYGILCWGGPLTLPGSGYGGILSIVSPQNGTIVTIIPSVTVSGHPAGVAYTVVLNQGETYQLTKQFVPDLSGTWISANQPVAVFTSELTAYIPGVCCSNRLVEQLLPVTTWGFDHFVMPLATRTGSTLRVMAAQDATTLNFNGSAVAVLNRGQVFQQIINAPTHVNSCHPLLVSQYSHSKDDDGASYGDPSMMLIPSASNFLSDYILTTSLSSFFLVHFLNIEAPASITGTVTLDGSPLPPGSFIPIGTSGFYGAQVSITAGTHRLAGPEKFGANVYGFGVYDAYSYPAGANLSFVARGLSVTPTSATLSSGSLHCVTATVSDSNGGYVLGLTVDFNVIGANPAAGSALTNSLGQAVFCYVGSLSGMDSIEASMCSLSNTASSIWGSPTPTPTFTASPSNTPSPSSTPTLTASPSNTPSPSSTPTFTVSPSMTTSPTPTPTFTVSPSVTHTPTALPTQTTLPTATPTPPSLLLSPLPSSPSPGGPDGLYIAYILSTDAEVKIRIFTVAGEIVRDLDPYPGRKGANEEFWDIKNNANNIVATGIFIAHIVARSPRGEEKDIWVKVSVIR